MMPLEVYSVARVVGGLVGVILFADPINPLHSQIFFESQPKATLAKFQMTTINPSLKSVVLESSAMLINCHCI